ncbi:MAG: hypothetical protein L0241_12250 [Planctomycetia bacterium]|nr:hypothetical protein [Planctomycetia bacterium]
MFVSQLRVVALGGFLLAGLVATGSAAPVPPERLKAEKELAVVAEKLHGSWGGGPCVGVITFRANRTYEWTGIGPAGERDEGGWGLIGDPAKPTLVMKCKTSDDPKRAGKTTEWKFAWLNEENVALVNTDKAALTSFARVKKESPAP